MNNVFVLMTQLGIMFIVSVSVSISVIQADACFSVFNDFLNFFQLLAGM